MTRKKSRWHQDESRDSIWIYIYVCICCRRTARKKGDERIGPHKQKGKEEKHEEKEEDMLLHR